MMTGVTFVLGGAASGKSVYAEQLVNDTGRPRVYLATAQAFDAEMKRKIADHVAQRGPGWQTVEVPLDPAAALMARDPGDIVLLDCATLWLTNVMLAERDVDAAVATLLKAIADCPCEVVVVSNEVGHGIVPDNALSRRFRNAQGRLNQKLAAISDRVILITAGLPQVLKDERPA